MRAAWTDFYDLHPDAQWVLRACAVLGHPSLSLVAAAAVVDSSVDHAAAIVRALAEHGWGSMIDDQFIISAPARSHLYQLAATTVEADVRRVVDQVTSAIITAARSDTALTSSIRTDVISVLQAANRHRRPDVATQVATVAWRTVTPQTSLAWCRELAEHGEEAAITSQQPELFVELLTSSAKAYSAVGDWQGTERAVLRTLAVVEALGDTARFLHFLDQLATNYQHWERPHKRADTLLEIVRVRQRGTDPVKTAQALAALGATMFDAGRPDAAGHYLTQAHRLLQNLPADPSTQALQASVLIDLGRVHAAGGSINSARTCYHQALILALDTDDELTQRIRNLQAALHRG